MAAKKTAATSALSFVVLLVIAVLKFCTKEQPATSHALPKTPPIEKQTPGKVTAEPTKKTLPSKKVAPTTQQKNGWTIYQNCQLVDHHNNDGDSFRVSLPDGKVQEFRLYFVDTPESTFKRYSDGKTNAERISQQARYFGNITPEAATAVGKAAKEFTIGLLKKSSFTLSTKNEDVYESGRFYCHVKLPYDGKDRWLDEILVSKGLVRIFTLPADLPDGTRADVHKSLLRTMEVEAKKRKVGAWK